MRLEGSLIFESDSSALRAFGNHNQTNTHDKPPKTTKKKVMALVGMAKPGPQLGRLLSGVMDWQLAHPDGSEADAAEHVKGAYARLQEQQGGGGGGGGSGGGGKKK